MKLHEAITQVLTEGLDEGIAMDALAKAKKDGMSDAAVDSFVKIHKANGRSNKEINAMLMAGKGLKKEDVELEEDTGRHTPNVTKAVNFVKDFDAGEMESFLLSLAEYFMYSHDDEANAKGVGSLIQKAYTDWKRRK